MERISYTLDDREHFTEKPIMTPEEILKKADLSPELYFLVEISGDEHKSFEGDPDAQIEMHDHMRFISKEYRIEYTLDAKDHFTTERVMTPEEILKKADLSPELYFLVEVSGHEHKTFEDDPGVHIEMHDHMRFISKGYHIEYVLDGEECFTDKRIMTPAEILQKAGLSPDRYYLVELIGDEQKSFQNKPNERIIMHSGMKFYSVDTGPTPVS